MTSHHVYTCIIVLGHIPLGHSYWKTNLSPFSRPSLQCSAFPSVAVSSNSQSSVHHFLITNPPLPNIQTVKLNESRELVRPSDTMVLPQTQIAPERRRVFVAELYQLCCPKCNNQTDLIAYATSSKCVNYVFRLYQQASSFVPKRLLQEPCNPQKENKDSPQRLSLLLNVVMNIQTGAGGRTRTGTVSLPMDFESITSANSITPAWTGMIIP